MSASADDRHARLTAIDDYVAGISSDADAAALEEDLFARAASLAGDDEVRFHDALTRNAAWLGAHPFSFRGGSTRAEVDALLATGRRVHYADLGPGGDARLPVWPSGTELVITRLGVDLRGCRDVEVDVAIGDGPVIKTFRECRYDPSDGALYAVCHEPLARLAFGHPRVVARVSAIRDRRRETVAVFDARQG